MASSVTLGIISIIFGIAVIAFPKFLRFIIGLYFILSGILILV
ncbi:DUF3096 domain-containing protein [Candidatus Woesearchaeota archaeon]|nr:DUF3096 domain-containing protein [Candidatus Woesearchaeota archaeon]